MWRRAAWSRSSCSACGKHCCPYKRFQIWERPERAWISLSWRETFCLSRVNFLAHCCGRRIVMGWWNERHMRFKVFFNLPTNAIIQKFSWRGSRQTKSFVVDFDIFFLILSSQINNGESYRFWVHGSSTVNRYSIGAAICGQIAEPELNHDSTNLCYSLLDRRTISDHCTVLPTKFLSNNARQAARIWIFVLTNL